MAACILTHFTRGQCESAQPIWTDAFSAGKHSDVRSTDSCPGAGTASNGTYTAKQTTTSHLSTVISPALDHIILDQHDLHFGFEQVMTLLWVSHTMGQMQGQEKCISVYICSRPKDRLFLYDWGAHLRWLSPGDEELVLLSMLSMVTNCSDGHIPNGAGFEVTSIWKRRGRTMDLDLLKA